MTTRFSGPRALLLGSLVTALAGCNFGGDNHSTFRVPTSIAIADVNGDGKLDAIVADNASSGRVVILPQDPANPGHFLAPVPLATPSAASGVAVGDINGDGRPDIAVADGNTATVMLQTTTPGVFANGTQVQ